MASVFPVGGMLWLVAARHALTRTQWHKPIILAAIVTAFAVGWILWGWGYAFALSTLTAIAAGVVRTQMRMKRAVKRAEAMSRLTSVLAYQSMASYTVTVEEALKLAAPLLTGPVGGAAADYATGYAGNWHRRALADFFHKKVPDCVAAEWLTEVVAVQSDGNIGGLLETLDSLAAEEAVHLRHAYDEAGTMLPRLVLITIISALVFGVMGAVAGIGGWLISPNGQLMIFLTATVIGATAAHAITSCSKLIRLPT